jgi:outer membrane murein-binding lipoprotein Lpp
MKISTLNATALASILVLAGGVAPALADETSELKAAVQALQKRIDQLEAKAKDAEDTNDRQTDQIAKTKAGIGSWVGNFTWKGDFRYRNENIDQEYVANRNRDRIRVRTGFVAKVNDTVKAEVELSTSETAGVAGNADPRSPNQTLTGDNSRKAFYYDLAYVEWQPTADWKFTAGKMKYPWTRPGANTYFFDSDVNPEGLAANFTHGGFFGSTFYNLLEERSPTGTGAASIANGESTLFGGQVGYKFLLGDDKLTVGTSFFSFNNVKGWNAAYNVAAGGTGAYNGNSTDPVATNCHFLGTTRVANCYAYGYQVWEAFGEYTTTLMDHPAVFWADYAHNSEAKNGLDTAYSLGVTYGKASDPGTWEVGYAWNHHEKDALFGQFVDSDFGAGSTDAEGSVLKAGYAPARNWVINGTYFINTTNNDRAATITGVPGVTTKFDRDYKRLQLDLNFKF